MPKQKLKPLDYAFAKMMQEKMGVKFVDSKGKPIEFEKAEQKDQLTLKYNLTPQVILKCKQNKRM